MDPFISNILLHWKCKQFLIVSVVIFAITTKNTTLPHRETMDDWKRRGAMTSHQQITAGCAKIAKIRNQLSQPSK